MKWLAVLAALFAFPAGAEVHTLSIAPIVQQHDNLCWAADNDHSFAFRSGTRSLL